MNHGGFSNQSPDKAPDGRRRTDPQPTENDPRLDPQHAPPTAPDWPAVRRSHHPIPYVAVASVIALLLLAIGIAHDTGHLSVIALLIACAAIVVLIVVIADRAV